MEHPSAIPPEDENTPIWRYMDFAKFIDLIEHRALFFSRANKLGDPYEGSIPKANVHYWNEFVNRVAETRGGNEKRKWLKAMDKMSEFRQKAVATFFVNCWHMNKVESAAMWFLYEQTGGAIAIRSKFSLLRSCLPEYFVLGTIRYIDYNYDSIPDNNAFSVIFHKRKSFEHEHEIRAVAWEMLSADLGGNEIISRKVNGGMRQEVSVEDLIEEVYVSPIAPNWLGNLVEDVLRRYGLTISVKKSTLNDPPSW